MPRTRTNLRAFLGFSNFYSRFVPSYADFAAPLTALTNGAGADEMQCMSDQLHMFEQLKHILTSSLVLQPFHLKTEHSQKGRGIGAVLF
jgi:hypothetical protein